VRRKILPTLGMLVQKSIAAGAGVSYSDVLEELAAARALIRRAGELSALIEDAHAKGNQVCGSEWRLVEAWHRLERLSVGARSGRGR
jgi:hypothetical protein